MLCFHSGSWHINLSHLHTYQFLLDRFPLELMLCCKLTGWEDEFDIAWTFFCSLNFTEKERIRLLRAFIHFVFFVFNFLFFRRHCKKENIHIFMPWRDLNRNVIKHFRIYENIQIVISIFASCDAWKKTAHSKIFNI